MSVLANKLLKKCLNNRYVNKLKRIHRKNSTSDPYLLYKDSIGRLRTYKPGNGTKIKLHFGCGARVLKGWINIDIYFTPYDDYLKYYTDKFYPEEIRGTKGDFYRIDVTRVGIPLPDDSVDIIFHEDFIEHLDQKEAIIFLAESLRVLKKGCVHRINTPDLAWSMETFSDFSKGINGVYAGEWTRHGHKNVFTPGYIRELALMVGYSDVKFGSRDHSIEKDMPLEYRPAGDRSENGNIFADLIK